MIFNRKNILNLKESIHKIILEENTSQTPGTWFSLIPPDSSQQSSPQRSSPQRSSPQRSSPQRSSPQRSSPTRPTSQRELSIERNAERRQRRAEREAKIAETRARAPKHTVISTPKKPEIRTVEPGYRGPSINPDGSFNITAEQQRVAAENRAGMQAARQGSRESATTQYGRLVQRMGPGALRPARSQYEAEQQAAARADLDKAYAEAGDRPIGYEDQERLYAGFARRGYRPGQPMSEYEVTQPANASYNAALENKKRVEAEVARSRAERMSRPQTALFRDPISGDTKSMTSAELDAAYERTKG